ncbi:hypothetical protein N431DRAFT_557091 [Stipitochalara longipes BDJ]|nr:hypothetical protein N431DRAFT_557091 [Stipitochalara longipes BDJ]
MSATPTTAAAEAQAGTTTFDPLVTESPVFFGWASVGNQAGTAVYSPVTCGLGSSFSASSLFATCCPIAGAGCPMFTSCGENSVLYGPEATSTCNVGSICKTDVVFQTVSASPTSVFFCNTGNSNSMDFYRTLPTPGFVYAQVDNNPLDNHHIILGAGAIGGLAVAAVIVIVFCAGLIHCCRRIANSPSRGVFAEPIPLTAKEQKRKARRAAERAVNDKYLDNQRYQNELNQRYDLAMRLQNQ